MENRIHVAVGIIFNSTKDKVLITKRTSNQHLAGLWEFPGGKLEYNEDTYSALCRELFEELGIGVINAKPFISIPYNYIDKRIMLDVWKVEEWNGEPSGREGQGLSWTSIAKLKNYEFPDANKHIIQSLSLTHIYVISQQSNESFTQILLTAENCFKSGIKLFQLRLESRCSENFPILLKSLSILSKKYNAKLILNGNPSDVIKYNIDGVHFKSKVLSKYVTRPVSEDYILGASCHNEEELKLAERLNVNYAFVSPVNKTSSHPENDAIGWEKFYELCNNLKFPVYALGGMTTSDVDLAESYGAYGVAMIGGILNVDNSVSD